MLITDRDLLSRIKNSSLGQRVTVPASSQAIIAQLAGETPIVSLQSTSEANEGPDIDRLPPLEEDDTFPLAAPRLSKAPLVVAVDTYDIELVHELLSGKNKADPNQPDEKGRLPLVEAMKKVYQCFSGKNFGRTNNLLNIVQAQTCLKFASETCIPIVTALLAFGADPFKEDNEKNNASMVEEKGREERIFSVGSVFGSLLPARILGEKISNEKDVEQRENNATTQFNCT